MRHHILPIEDDELLRTSCLELYLKACQRFPGLRWILTETNIGDVEGVSRRRAAVRTLNG